MDKEAWILAKLTTTFGSFVCALKGRHRRAKAMTSGRREELGLPFDATVTRHECPRCGRVKSRKVKQQKAPRLVNDLHEANRTRYEGQEKEAV